MLTYPEIVELASKLHGNQTYGADEPYKVHLDEVEQVLVRFGYIHEKFPRLHAAARCHDLLEDAGVTVEQLVALGVDPAAVAIAEKVTDEPGATRKERKLKTYPKIASDPEAVIIKLADRIANVERGGKIDMYRQEHEVFGQYLRNANPDAKPMWEHLDRLLGK